MGCSSARTRSAALAADRSSAGSALADDWLAKQLHELKHNGPSQVLADLRGLVAKHPNVKELTDHLAYLDKREAQMQYPTFQAAGWPIGSGARIKWWLRRASKVPGCIGAARV